jgi:hypothetical protein
MAFMGLGRLKPIAPNDDNYTHTFRKEFATDALVTEFQFHMHYRGCAASVVFARPDGTIVPGIEVPRYNFNWQRQYNLVEPIAVPRGTKALVTLRWDNSAANPLNPDPSAEVRFGLLTTNEMAAAGIGYYDSDSILEEPITVRNGRRVDSPQHVE